MGSQDSGTIFEVTPSGDFTIIYTFAEFVGITSNLVQATNGDFYGGTESTIFQVTASGEYKTIVTLTQAEGPTPTFLMQASDGNLWGLSVNGGTAPARPGTVFAFTTTGTLVTTTEFSCGRGCNPGAMTQGSDGNFYGVALAGGNGRGHAKGAVFKIDAGLPAPRH